MKTVHTIAEVRAEIKRARALGKSVGLVPTMGALHAGHMALVRRAREQCGFVAVSVFVNPTQFGPSEDLDKYPRTLPSDQKLCEEAGVDFIFAPSAAEMYPPGFDSWVEVGGVTARLEGASRPGHFRGVATVCTKLFSILTPDRAYFGRKDYQQLKVMQKVVRDLNLPLEIVPVETVREDDGLARSSRNRYLNPDERRAALVLSKALSAARTAVQSGQTSALAIQNEVVRLIEAEPLATVDYVDVADAETLEPLTTLRTPAVILLAVRIGSTRLIDNALLDAL